MTVKHRNGVKANNNIYIYIKSIKTVKLIFK